LHEAAQSGTVALASLYYIYRGADATDAQKLMSAYLAKGEDHRRTAEMLINKGADVNAKDSHGDTPLHYAAQTGWKFLAGLLIATGADVSAKGKDGRTALHYAAEKVNTRFYEVNKANHHEMVELLIEKGADVNAVDSSGRTPLRLAAGAPHQDMAELFKKHGALE